LMMSSTKFKQNKYGLKMDNPVQRILLVRYRLTPCPFASYHRG
jgi:hypothetical protein